MASARLGTFLIAPFSCFCHTSVDGILNPSGKWKKRFENILKGSEKKYIIILLKKANKGFDRDDGYRYSQTDSIILPILIL